MTTFTLTDHGLNVRLDRAANEFGKRAGLLKVLGRELRNQLVTHFRTNDRTLPNKLGGKRTHFWLEVARLTNQPVVAGDEVTVSISHPLFRQKLEGGPIEAKRAKNLSLPQVPEAHGRTAATYEKETGFKLFFLQQRDHALLARHVGQHGIEVVYLLTPRVNQKPDPNALPPRQNLIAALLARADSWIDNQLAAQSGSQN